MLPLKFLQEQGNWGLMIEESFIYYKQKSGETHRYFHNFWFQNPTTLAIPGDKTIPGSIGFTLLLHKHKEYFMLYALLPLSVSISRLTNAVHWHYLNP